VQFSPFACVLLWVLYHLNEVLDFFFDLVNALYIIKPLLNVLCLLDLKLVVVKETLGVEVPEEHHDHYAEERNSQNLEKQVQPARYQNTQVSIRMFKIFGVGITDHDLGDALRVHSGALARWDVASRCQAVRCEFVLVA
jgi:hypothetical protein